MKRIDVNAFSLDQAKEIAAEAGIVVTNNVTQSWINAKRPMSDKEFKAFAVEMLQKKRFDQVEGVGLIVAVEPGSKDTRERPYKFVNNVVEGKRNIKRVFEIRVKSTDKLVGEADSKGEAEKLAKKLMAELREDLTCTIVYRVIEDKAKAFDLVYTPSASAKEGKYIVFGNEKF